MDETKSMLSGAEQSERGRLRRTVVHAVLSMAGAVCGLTPTTADAQGAPPAVIPGATTVDPSAPTQAPALSPAPATPSVLPPVSVPAELPPASAPAVIAVPATPPPAPPAAAAPPPAPPPLAPPPAAGPGWMPVITGSYFTRYELRSGYDDLGLSSPTARQRFLEGDAIYYRARLGIGTGLIDLGSRLKVGLQFTPQVTGTFGNLTTNSASPNTIVDAAIGLHEGYARVQGLYTRFDAGRFELNYGDALVLGNLDWNEIGRSFDGVRARITKSPSSAWLDFFATVIDEGRPDLLRGSTFIGTPATAYDSSPGIGLGDVYFVGAYAGLGPAIAKTLDLDAYVLTRAWGTAKTRITPTDASSAMYRRKNAAEATFGLRAKQKVGSFDYRAEGGIQVGSRPGTPSASPANTVVESVDVFAYQGDLELGVSLGKDLVRISLEGLYASGDNTKTTGKNEGWNELFPTAHKFLGLTDAFNLGGQKRTNVASGVGHLTVAPIKNLTFQFDAHIFARPEKIQISGPRGPNTLLANGLAGGEIDVGAVLVLAKGLKTRALYGAFLPNNHIYRDTLPANALQAKSADPAHFFELELRYDLQ